MSVRLTPLEKQYVKNALIYGLSDDEIKDDIIDRRRRVLKEYKEKKQRERK